MAFMLIHLYNEYIKPLFEEQRYELPITMYPDIENNINEPIIIYQSVIDKSGEVVSSWTGL